MTKEKRIFIKPATAELVVRRFDKKGFPRLAVAGEWVALHPQWIRFLKAGDIVTATPPSATKTKTKTESKTKGDN